MKLTLPNINGTNGIGLLLFFYHFLYQHLHIKPKNLQSPAINIYVVIYLGTK